MLAFELKSRGIGNENHTPHQCNSLVRRAVVPASVSAREETRLRAWTKRRNSARAALVFTTGRKGRDYRGRPDLSLSRFTGRFHKRSEASKFTGTGKPRRADRQRWPIKHATLRSTMSLSAMTKHQLPV